MRREKIGFIFQSFNLVLELAAYYVKVRGLYNRIFGVLGLMIVMMVFFAVANTLSMVVVERTREIGT